MSLFGEGRGDGAEAAPVIQGAGGINHVRAHLRKAFAAFALAAAIKRDARFRGFLAVAVSVVWWSLLRAPERAVSVLGRKRHSHEPDTKLPFSTFSM